MPDNPKQDDQQQGSDLGKTENRNGDPVGGALEPTPKRTILHVRKRPDPVRNRVPTASNATPVPLNWWEEPHNDACANLLPPALCWCTGHVPPKDPAVFEYYAALRNNAKSKVDVAAGSSRKQDILEAFNGLGTTDKEQVTRALVAFANCTPEMRQMVLNTVSRGAPKKPAPPKTP